MDASDLVRLAADNEALEAEKARRSLHAYVLFMWQVLEPKVAFKDNWHIQVICEHLEAVTRGQIRRLLITVPPRHLKSTCATVMWPTWEWIDHPEEKYLSCSYASALSTRDALHSRRIIDSDIYRRQWGGKFNLTGDQNQKTRYENDQTGYRIATSVGALLTGEGGTRIIVDDPHNLDEIRSDVMRKGVLDWWDSTMSTRLNDPKRDAYVGIMQRGHEEDWAGHVLSQGGWVHLNLPAEYEGARIISLCDKKPSVLATQDPRKVKGELLHEERFGATEITQLKATLGEYNTAAQLQQRPAPLEGGMLKRKDFRLWPADVPLPRFEAVLLTYDTAFTENTMNDPAAGQCWALFNVPRTDPIKRAILLLDAWQEHYKWGQLRKRVYDDWKSKYGGKEDAMMPSKDVPLKPGRRPELVIVENKGLGITLLQDLNAENIPAFSYNPGRADKVVRVSAVSPLVEVGVVYLMESAKRRGEPISWATEPLHQWLTFPNAKDDHHVDCLTQLLIYLRDIGLLRSPLFHAEDFEPDPYVRKQDRPGVKRPANPYAQ